MKKIKCINCKQPLISTGVATSDEEDFMSGVNGICEKCGIFYKDDEPIAVQRGDKIIKL